MGLGILRAVKMTSIVGKRFLHLGRKNGNKGIAARVSPYYQLIIYIIYVT